LVDEICNFPPIARKVGFTGILQENQTVAVNQELFIINPGNTDFFEEIQFPQYNIGKIKLGQRTVIKFRIYSFEEYGIINGKISYLTEVALKVSVFVAR
jgi:HlyD family secretion protein